MRCAVRRIRIVPLALIVLPIVTVAGVVNTKGNLQDFRVTQHSPLAPEVIDSLTTLVFTPASLNGAPVSVCYMSTIKISNQ
jgi:hypothetical protein